MPTRTKTLTSVLLTLVAGAAIVVRMQAQPPAQGRGGSPVDLPDGPGKEQVQSMCAGCHPLTNITNSRGNSKEGWDALTSGMIALPPLVKPQVLTYLGTHFPRKPGGEPVLVPGAASISIREWVVPTLGSRPHDPLAAADGSSGGPASGATSSDASIPRPAS